MVLLHLDVAVVQLTNLFLQLGQLGKTVLLHPRRSGCFEVAGTLDSLVLLGQISRISDEERPERAD